MLEEIRASYIKTANTIKGWRELDKNTLLNLYIDNEHDEFLKNGYFAAIVIKYWSAIGKYYSDSKNSVNIEECYDWFDSCTHVRFEKQKMERSRFRNIQRHKRSRQDR